MSPGRARSSSLTRIQALGLGQIQRAQDGRPPGFRYAKCTSSSEYFSPNTLCWQYLVAQRQAVVPPFVRLRDEASRNRTAICDLSFNERKRQELCSERCFDFSSMTPDSATRKLTRSQNSSSRSLCGLTIARREKCKRPRRQRATDLRTFPRVPDSSWYAPIHSAMIRLWRYGDGGTAQAIC